jgi:natural product biosynthesis luciferase-like monooxygenase protein
MVRALDFGPYANPMGRATIRFNGTALSATQAILRREIHGRPGQVIDIGPDELIVACGSAGLAFKALATPSGQPLSIMEAAQFLNLSIGDTLDAYDGDLDDLTAISARLAKNEAAQVRRLTGLDPVILPWARSPVSVQETRFEILNIAVPPQLAEGAGEQIEAALVGAFGVVLARITGKERVCLAAVDATVVNDAARAGNLVSPWAPFDLRLDMQRDFHHLIQSASDEMRRLAERGSFSADLIARDPDLGRRMNPDSQVPFTIGLRLNVPGEPERGCIAELALSEGRCRLHYDAELIESKDAVILVDCLEHALQEMCGNESAPIGQIDILNPNMRAKVLEAWNAPRTDVPELCIHSVIEQQVDRSPDAVAAIFEDSSITFAELDRRANKLAAYLRSLGVGSDQLVGIHVERSIELLVSVLAVLKAGGAYVPLDPTYPADRIQHMISDSGCAVILTTSASVESLSSCYLNEVAVVAVDKDADRIGQYSNHRLSCEVQPDNLCYCIYTSGSTGLPKGVLIEHRNVINFFAGMDDRIDRAPSAVWMAVTSLSFDISVLELLYTVARGFTVVIYRDRDREEAGADATLHVADKVARSGGVDFSLFYFSGNEADSAGSEKYRLLLEGARWADSNGFCAVWTPERHFHAFGGLYPQPAVTAAAVAAVTKNVSVRAGSVVMPLHHPIRVAEAWSIVDNLSNGRAAISIASGWQPDDFVLMPENYANAKDVMFRNMEIVQRLWRGEKVAFPGPLGKDVEVQTLPRPVQAELPIWVTTAGNPETFQQAGRIGANILTHLLGQTVEQLEPKIAAYRQARAEAGFDPDRGIVSLMLHTFVSDDEEAARETAREPLKAYLSTSLSLLKHYAWAFPAFKKPKSGEAAGGDDLAGLTDEERDAILEFAFLRYYETSGLFGTPATAQAMVDSLKAIGVNDVACLIDFGIGTDTVLASLPYLGALCGRNRQVSTIVETGTADGILTSLDQSIAAQLARHRVTHMQCTPSMARLLTLQEDTRAALAKVPNLFIGGEAFPVGLAKELSSLTTGRVTNMYGPTETTIWSTTWALHGELESVPVGAPIANTSIYILDAQRQPLPPGVPGELWIGGYGVARGYHRRPELTSERFVPDPFVGGSARMYRTGDLAKWKQLEDGSGIVEFLGRVDHQVKIRGHRIELGEIEARLAQHPAVRECVVVARPDPAGDQQLAAFISARSGQAADPSEIRDSLRDVLPEAMVPAHVVVLSSLPHTLNGKIDRNALPSLTELQSRRPITVSAAVVESELEQTVLAAWHKTLGDDSIRVNDNFFDVGGHSLLVVRLHRTLRDVLKQPVALTDLYRFPTVRSFVASLSADTSAVAAQRGLDRAARRRESLQRRNQFH